MKPEAAAQEAVSFRRAHGLAGNPLIGSITPLTPGRGLELLLKAMPGILLEFPQAQLVLVGEGPFREELVRLAYGLKIQDRVVITHPMKEARVPLAVIDCVADSSLINSAADPEGLAQAILARLKERVPLK